MVLPKGSRHSNLELNGNNVEKDISQDPIILYISSYHLNVLPFPPPINNDIVNVNNNKHGEFQSQYLHNKNVA